jgi:hypothetical protein
MLALTTKLMVFIQAVKNRDDSAWGPTNDEEMFSGSGGPWIEEGMYV